ncbi:hypothetical protein B0T21DRAFT_195596 [Apiosordaria backusii]|uniref:F-box domain-containing protein n=1 Tax=Apiosordaria backusii TaxID=314023 RepID=A0AA40BDZ1_9PEZI|nr:hypothetical protein B0T21DRAFT_195596 [Apiosordaria backusii]
MDRIFLRLRYLLPGYQRRLSAQKRCTLKIPTELVDMILEHLQPESAIAFALTCRALFVKHFPKSAQLSAPARATLLQWLEQDIPRLYFCHGCAYLHPWRARLQFSGYKFYHGPCWWNLRDIDSVMSKLVSPFRSDLTYSWARLVMNRHLYGALHGPPLQDIEATQHRCSFSGVIIKIFCTAKIISNNLYIHSTMVLRSDGKKGNAQSLRTFIKHYECSLVCRHLRAAMIPELCRDEESSRPFHPTSGNIRSCAFCFTDYQIRVALVDSPRRTIRKSSQRDPIEGEDWSIEVAGWHNLGECRSPHDLEWCNLVTGSPSRILVRREDMCGAGMVHRVWTEEDLGSAPVMETAVFSNSCAVI